MLIADISVVLAWFFQDRQTAQALDVLKGVRQDGLLVPSLWWSELENGLLMGERRGRKQPAESAEFLRLIRALPIHTDDVPRHQLTQNILDIARRHNLTAYDAAYLELAARQGVPLATFDADLRRSAPNAGVTLF